jgi:UDP-3-O-[3-hydroxymyristoyl] glucosamine N-acyltransferase
MKLPKDLSLKEIAFFIGGKVEGNPDTKVSTFAMNPLNAKEGDLAVLFDKAYLKRIDECKASAAIVPTGTKCSMPHITVDRPLLAMQRMLGAMQPKRFLPPKGIHPTAVVDETATIGEGVALGPYVVVGPHSTIGENTIIMANCVIGGKVTIGRNCLLHPGCLIADYTQIGNRVIMQQGASIGSDGFSYVTEKMSNIERRLAGIKPLSKEQNSNLKIPNIGNVVIEDDCEIGANATIDRATVGSTKIGAGTKIDNLVMIAHNCTIGKDVLIISQTAVAGSCKVHDRAILAGQVGLKDHITVGADAIVEAQAGVLSDIAEEAVVVGSPALPARELLTTVAYSRKGPQMYKQLRALQKKVDELEAKLNGKAMATSTK